MKRYFAFYGERYYPLEGMDNFLGDYDTIEESLDEIINVHLREGNEKKYWGNNWYRVWDSIERVEILNEVDNKI